MFTLSDASKDTKQFLKIGGIIIGVIVFVFILIKMAIIVKEIIAPTPPPKPTVSFGKLTPQVFPQNLTTQNLSYTIDTLSGALPGAPQTVKVYRIQLPQPDLMAVTNFQNKIANVDFAQGYIAISDKVFEWKSEKYAIGIAKTIRTNIVTNNFIISSEFLSDTNVLSGKNLPNQLKAVDIAQGFLSDMNLLSDDLDTTKTKTNLYSITNGNLTPSTSLSNTQIIEVNFYQKDTDKLPIYYDKPNSSNINILVSGGDTPQIVAANYIHQIISSDSSTYPIKSSTQAFEDLKQGKGYIASYSSNSSSVSIADVSLDYYMSSQSQDFLMPIFIFKGSGNFIAYVPALTDEWINK